MSDLKDVIGVYHPKTHRQIGYILQEPNAICTVDCTHRIHSGDFVLLTDSCQELFTTTDTFIFCLLDADFVMPTHYYQAHLSTIAIPRNLHTVTKVGIVECEADNLSVVQVADNGYNIKRHKRQGRQHNERNI